MDDDKGYAQGLMDGKIEALEATAASHALRLDQHSVRLHLLERALWLMLGVVAAIEFLPRVFDMMTRV